MVADLSVYADRAGTSFGRWKPYDWHFAWTEGGSSADCFRQAYRTRQSFESLVSGWSEIVDADPYLGKLTQDHRAVNRRGS